VAEMFNRIQVIGIGNLDRGDDAAGCVAAQRLKRRVPQTIEIAELDGEPSALIERLSRASAAWIIDACRSGAPAGTLYRFDASAHALPDHGLRLSSHGVGLSETLELARALKQLPAVCIVHAVEGAQFDHGAPLSAAVSRAIDAVAEKIRGEVSAVSHSSAAAIA